jgi:transcriptional regulator with XRE-family HTH domain
MSSALRPSEFGSLLRHWRRTRGVSQLELAGQAGMSARHLSFLETGRCGPSRDSVLQLGRALDLPRDETERLLLVAGHAGDWTRLPVDSSRVREQLGKLAHLLAAHDPFPAIVTDPDWCVAFGNRGARAFFERLKELVPTLCGEPPDLRRLLADESGLGGLIANRDELLAEVLAGLYQLEPDPACFGHARSLLDVLPSADRAGPPLERAARAIAWQHVLELRDGRSAFSLELFSLPFARPVSGFALVLMQPADTAAGAPAERYFKRLLARFGRERSGLPAW